jgi:hypothetical protein
MQVIEGYSSSHHLHGDTRRTRAPDAIDVKKDNSLRDGCIASHRHMQVKATSVT